ncbi:glycosyltransferase family 2 protein [Aequorivita sediminis]|uniref:glycosyltransferase family 2 protein n=1 Tax=Aequorivita sediminis TaxID=3073653 RepID=UPI0028AA9BEC|nr:glycosyltransferase family 2 protein [Aequorivita sp. F6058]
MINKDLDSFKNQPLISIIVPVFNKENFLRECLDSIINQDYQNFELIVVNDGSTDGSKIICEEYAAKYDQIILVHTENGGVSSARNKGLQIAKGEWVTFVDSDDYISKDYLNIVLKTQDRDFIIVNIDRVKNNGIERKLQFKNEVLNLNEFLQTYKVYPNYAELGAKFMKLSIIKNNNLSFHSNLNYGEDTLFNLKYLAHCKNIELSNRSVYFYRDVTGSLSKQTQDYSAIKKYYQLINEELKCFSTAFLENNIKFPFYQLISSLYKDKNLKTELKERELKTIINSNFNLMMNFYKDSKIKYLLLLTRKIGNTALLSKFIIGKTK